MRKIFLIMILFLIPMFLFAGEGDYENGYYELFADDTLAADGVDSTYTTVHEQFSDTLYFSFWLLAEETGAQVGDLDISLAFSPDSSSGFSANTLLEEALDVGATCDDAWYELAIGTLANDLYSMKWIKVVIDNSAADANEVIIKSMGITFKKED